MVENPFSPVERTLFQRRWGAVGGDVSGLVYGEKQQKSTVKARKGMGCWW